MKDGPISFVHGENGAFWKHPEFRSLEVETLPTPFLEEHVASGKLLDVTCAM